MLLRVTAYGGEELLISDMTLERTCGEESAGIIENQFDDLEVFIINGEVPSFTIDAFTVSSSKCSILTYVLYSDKENEIVHEEF